MINDAEDKGLITPGKVSDITLVFRHCLFYIYNTNYTILSK
jgi:hypothetical protein